MILINNFNQVILKVKIWKLKIYQRNNKNLYLRKIKLKIYTIMINNYKLDHFKIIYLTLR